MTQVQVGSRKAQSFTFGVEIECFIPRTAMTEYGIRRGGYHNGLPLPAPFPIGWECQADSSLRTTRNDMVAVEIVSPKLSGMSGILSVRRVVELLKGLGAAVNPSCGLHVHVGIASVVPNLNDRAEWIGRLMYEVAMNEDALYAQTGTRRRSTNGYASSIKNEKSVADTLVGARTAQAKDVAIRFAANGTQRMNSLNLTNLLNPSKLTVEFRAFAPTLEWKKAYAHIQTCLALCERATERTAMDWDAIAGEFYSSRTAALGMRSLRRFFYLAGWVKGRRQTRQAEVEMAGWIAPLEDLKAVRAEMRRLARKYDGAA